MAKQHCNMYTNLEKFEQNTFENRDISRVFFMRSLTCYGGKPEI